MSNNYQGIYINLARSRDRDASVQSQLQSLGWQDRYERFEAVDGKTIPQADSITLSQAELGCWLSHLHLLDRYRSRATHLHVVEDDVKFHSLLPKAFSGPAEAFDWDLMFTDVYFHPVPTPEQFYQFQQAMLNYRQDGRVAVLSLQAIRFTGSTSYFVHRDRIGKVFEVLNDGWKNNQPLDLFIQSMVEQQRLRAFVMLPFFTTIGDLNIDSTVGHQGPILETLNLFRKAFYVDADQDALYRESLQCGADQSPAALLGLYFEAIKATLSTAKQKIKN
jgi:GR25 family glycosyltransferase involved in LPS biosynthesis